MLSAPTPEAGSGRAEGTGPWRHSLSPGQGPAGTLGRARVPVPGTNAAVSGPLSLSAWRPRTRGPCLLCPFHQPAWASWSPSASSPILSSSRPAGPDTRKLQSHGGRLQPFPGASPLLCVQAQPGAQGPRPGWSPTPFLALGGGGEFLLPGSPFPHL